MRWVFVGMFAACATLAHSGGLLEAYRVAEYEVILKSPMVDCPDMGCINGFMSIKNENGICQCEKIDGVVDDGAINPELWAIMERAQMDKISLWKNGSHRSFKRYYCAPWKDSDDLCCVARPGTEKGWDVDEVTFNL